MPEGRIDRISVANARAAVADLGLHDTLADLSVFRIALRNPSVAQALYGLLRNLLWSGQLDGRLRELVIMRIGWSTGSVYEWTQHWRVATGLDIPAEDLLAVRDWESSDRFGPLERAVLAATDSSLATGEIGDEAWARCRELLTDDAQLVELVAVIGTWTLFSGLLRSLAVPLEDGVAPWPPDGQTPPG